MPPFLSSELTRSNVGTPGSSSRLIERRFVPLTAQDARERSERFASLLLRGALILTSTKTGEQCEPI